MLEATQIVSSPIFDEMVEDYLGSDDPEEVEPLKAYWAAEYGVVFPEVMDVDPADQLSIGKSLHEESCAFCHVKPDNAFISYPLSKSIRSFAVSLNSVRADIWLWHAHYMLCFIGLALLPFSKFFHIISVPLNLLLRDGQSNWKADDPDRFIQRAVGMDACTHCGICSLHCSVMPIYRVTANPNVLPSEKLLSAKTLARGGRLDHEGYLAIAEGNFACTDCYRCTQVCPSGIDLHDLWQASRRELEKRKYSRPDQWIREYPAAQWASFPAQHDRAAGPEPREYLLRNMTPESFSSCVQCTVCANVCPVVSVPDSLAAPEATPQQVMNLLRLDMRDLAMASRMVWDCMTCYMCQEHCPQGIRVTDILYELRSLGARQLEPVRFSGIEKKNPGPAQR
jgi:heterodisulfide reductase subunit C